MGSLARKAWERLRLYRVNLIALQRRRDPEQVLLQCLPRNKVGAAEGWGAGGGVQGVGRPASGSPAPQVDATLRRLLERYRGPEPSDTGEMFEGEKFFAAFERGIDIDAGVPRRPEKGCWVCPRVPAEPPSAHRPPRLRGGQAVLCFLFPPEEPEGGVRDHCPGPTGSGCERPGGPVGCAPRAAWAKTRALKPTSSSPPGVLLPGRGARGGA